MAELQMIPARHGTATFVPAGQTIKIINTSGSQVIDTWAFALPKPEPKKGSQEEKDVEQEKEEESKQDTSKGTPAKTKKNGMNLPSQQDAEKATSEGLKEGEEAGKDAKQQKSGWGSYVPSIGWSKRGNKDSRQETQQQKDSRTWSSYFQSGKGFSTYIPKSATDTASAFATAHKRDPDKTYLEQLQELSKTPVGAAGMAALTGSGYSSAAYAGYQAWSSQQATAPPMEYMSMPHSRAATLHLRPKVNDTLVSNLREPILTLVEDTSPGIHDTLIAACDPLRYKGLGVDKWEEHGSCAENLVLALKELNERAGLKGNKGVGADITINSVPAPLNLFMNIPWDESGDIGFQAPKSKKDDFVRFKAERDVVVVMSACPQDILDINNKKPTDAHFIVEGDEEPKQAIKRSQPKRRPPPRKIASSHATSTVGSVGSPPQEKKPVPTKKYVPPKKTDDSSTAQPAPAAKKSTPAAKPTTQGAQPAKKKPVPKPVQPLRKQSSSAMTPATDDGATTPVGNGGANAANNGASTAANNGAATAATDASKPVERKKPKKLSVRPKPEAPTES